MIRLNYALIIQGPIYSPGRTGKTFFHKELSKNSIVDYYCEANILRTLNNFGHLFQSVHIVTWSNETINESLFEKFDNCKLLKLQNITPNIKIDNKQLPTDFNNKYKQFYALSKGLELVQDAEYVIKIRTDQYIDLQDLIEEHQRFIKNNTKNAELIHIPYINKINYLPSDFYFVATKKKLSEFSEAMLWGNYLEFNSSVHIDMSLKYAYLYHRKKLNIPLRTYFLNSFSKNTNQSKIKLTNYLSKHIYNLFSSKIFENTEWRGDLITLSEEAKETFVFSEKYSELQDDEKKYKPSTITDFLYINFPAYLVVKFPILRNTFVESLTKRCYRALKKTLKK